jgi:cobalamin biosynthesis protein CobD/CbiB
MPQGSQDQHRDNKTSKPAFSERAKYAALTDLCFILLPFIVIAIVLALTGRIRELLYIPEWSIATPVVVGQTISRMVSGVINRSVDKEPIVFMLCAIIVVLLVPSLIILGFVLEAPRVTTAMATTQMVLFVAGVVVSFAMTSLIFDVEHNTDPERQP